MISSKNNPLVKNRLRLLELVYELGVFTEGELLQKFWIDRNGDMALSGGQTVQEFLRDLHESDKLRYDRGRGVYSVVKP